MLTRCVMRHMLFRQMEKADVPVPRSDLAKLFTSYKKGNVAGAIIKQAQARFPTQLGLEMKELQLAPQSRSKKAIGGQEGLQTRLHSAIIVFAADAPRSVWVRCRISLCCLNTFGSKLSCLVLHVHFSCIPHKLEATPAHPAHCCVGDHGQKYYVLRSMLPSALCCAFVQQPKDDATRGLEMLVLALVHMSGEKLQEGVRTEMHALQ